MCGIAGWFSPHLLAQDSRQQALIQLKKMADQIAHRGPDGEGIVCLDYVGFAHRRLSILDLEHGGQPMFDVSSRCCIVFNGEIYNYKQLKKGLEDSGSQFKTDCDTEVILQLYLREGVKGFLKLRGMYAFALWDRDSQLGVMLRDPLGIKPLFYHYSAAGELIFGSEAKAIIAKNKALAELDTTQLHFLMNCRYIPTNGSLFSGVKQLEPGVLIQWRPDTGVQKQYLFNTHEEGSYSSNIQALGEGLIDNIGESVKRHMVSDVEVGAYLSGGIDSAIVTTLAKDLSSNRLRTFTLDVGDDPMESINAQRSANLLGVENIQKAIEVDSRSDLAKLIWHLEVPKVNSLQVMKIADHASQSVKVALSGLGADELFLGYNVHGITALLAGVSSKMPNSMLRLGGAVGQKTVSQFNPLLWSEPWRFFDMLRKMPEWSYAYAIMRNVWDSPGLRKAIYGPRMLDQSLPQVHEWIAGVWPVSDDPVTSIKQFEWRHKMVNDLLWQEDRCSMANGLEVRVPFVDWDLKQLYWELDRKTLMPNRKKKGYLKENIQSLLPNEILNRKKSGFQVDAAQFFDKYFSMLADEFLNPEYTRKVGLFNPDFVAMVRKLPMVQATRWHYFMLYLMLGVHFWVEIFEQGNKDVS